MKNRFSPFGTQHVCRRSNDWGVIFYDDIDRLVCYSIFACQAKKYGVTVCMASLMYTHTHESLRVGNRHTMEKYVRDSGSQFARAYNYRWKRHGALFHRKFKWDSKTTLQQQKTNFCYIANNHREKGLVGSARQSRWDFVPYAFSRHPFSPKLILKESDPLTHAVALVKNAAADLRPLRYSFLLQTFPKLSDRQREQLTDYIISEYALVDFGVAEECFGSLEKMSLAFDSNSGSEYKIREEYNGILETSIEEMCSIVKKQGLLGEVYNLTKTQKANLFERFRRDMPEKMIRKFLHLG